VISRVVDLHGGYIAFPFALHTVETTSDKMGSVSDRHGRRILDLRRRWLYARSREEGWTPAGTGGSGQPEECTS
jgi:hypothetical protein